MVRFYMDGADIFRIDAVQMHNVAETVFIFPLNSMVEWLEPTLRD